MSAKHGDGWKRLAMGLAGGAAGLVAMQLVQRVTRPLVKPRPHKPTDVFETERSMSPLGTHHHPDESATDAIARLGYTKIAGQEPSPKLKKALSWGVHIGYGLAVASLWGLARGTRSRRTRVRHIVRDGLVFGAALWLAGDELAVPLLGLADKPTAYSPSSHVQALAAHLGYGVATTAATRYLENAL